MPAHRGPFAADGAGLAWVVRAGPGMPASRTPGQLPALADRAVTLRPDEYPILLFQDREAWAGWLRDNHATGRGVWLRVAKAASELRSVTIAEALDVALCYGWIDGQRKASDADSYLQKFTPRGKKSLWSKRNREHVERLVAGGLMQPPGLAAVEAAKADGRWERAYDAASTAEVPADLQAALNEHPEAARFFGTLSRTNRFVILYRIQTAVKAETRARRIAEFTEMLERKEVPRP
jgi:uncharacterized protein YdeI (YjbR/CyaY-like superfamily)